MELSGKVIAVLEPRGGVSKTGNAWKVERAGAQPAPVADVPFPPMNAAPVDFSAGDEKDDLPF